MEFGETKWFTVKHNVGKKICQILAVAWFPKSLGLLITTWDSNYFLEVERFSRFRSNDPSKKYEIKKVL